MTNTPVNPQDIPIEDVLDPILFGDPVLQQLNTLAELNVPRLMELSGKPLQSVNSIYKTEIFIHLSYLMTTYSGMSRQDLADAIGMHEDNLSKNISKYNLPRSFNRFQHRIKARQLKKQMKEVADYVYTIHKIDFLHQLHQDRKQDNNLKEVAKLSDLPYQKTRDWFNQYRLEEMLKERQLEIIADTDTTIKVQRVSAASIPPLSDIAPRMVVIDPMTRLFTAEGDIVRAKDLVTNPDLIDGSYLMLTPDLQVVQGGITDANFVKSTTTKIITRMGERLQLGPYSRLIVDRETGMVVSKPSELIKKDMILSFRPFTRIATYKVSIFSLLKPPPGEPQLKFVFKSAPDIKQDISYQIKERLKATDHKSRLKQACMKLGISFSRYKHGILKNNYHHDELQKIHAAINYPDIHHPHFLNDVKTVQYAIQGGQPMPVDHLILEPDLLYLMGLIASDGYGSNARKAVVGFSNKLLPLVHRFRDIMKKYFPQQTMNVSPSKDKKIGEKIYRSTYELAVNNYAIRMLMINLNIKGSYHLFDEDYAYEPIFKLPLHLIAAFLQGLFDGDGSVEVARKQINTAVFHPQRSRTVHLLYGRLGILTKIKESEQTTRPPGSEEDTDSQQTNIQVAGRQDISKYIDIIHSQHPDRSVLLDQLWAIVKDRHELSSKYRRAPRLSAKLFRKLRENAGITQNQVYNSSVSDFERLASRPSIARVSMFVERLVELGVDTTSPEYLQLQELLKPVYNFDLIKEIVPGKKQKMVRLITNNRLVTGIGTIVDGKPL